MKALKIWIAMLMFNFSMAFILLSGIFPTTYGQPYNYEPGFQSSALNSLNLTIGTNNNDQQQYAASANILDIIRRGITFDWVFDYVPNSLAAAENMLALRAFLAAMAIVINGAMIIELWIRFRDPLD